MHIPGATEGLGGGSWRICYICAFVKYSIFQGLEKVLKAVFVKVLHGFGAFAKSSIFQGLEKVLEGGHASLQCNG